MEMTWFNTFNNVKLGTIWQLVCENDLISTIMLDISEYITLECLLFFYQANLEKCDQEFWT